MNANAILGMVIILLPSMVLGWTLGRIFPRFFLWVWRLMWYGAAAFCLYLLYLVNV